MALASELERRGRHVAGIVLLDTYAPGIGASPSSMKQAEEMGWAHLMKMYGLTENEGERLAELAGAPSIQVLEDGRTLIKQTHRGRSKDLFNLVSATDKPILDVPIQWATRVNSISRRRRR